MSRIGRKPIEIPSGVTVEVSAGGTVKVSGPLGTLEERVPARMELAQDDGVLTVTRPTERGDDRALHGLTRTLVANMVEGVTKGFEKHLEIQGVGYRAQLKGSELELAVGFSHPVTVAPREGISFEVPQPTQVIVKGISKQVVGQTAAEIRKVRPPEPYKGKGIRYQGEHVRRKVGKRAA
jgi:large subunit ribosomal protein L6